MAKKAKPGKTPETETDDTVEKIEETSSADVIDATAKESDTPVDDSADAKSDVAEAPAVDAEPGDKAEDAKDAEGEILTPDAEPEPNTEPGDDFSGNEAPEPTPVPVQPPEPVIIRKGGFVPMVLGGVAAAAIGFGAAQYLGPWSGDDGAEFQADVSAKLDAQAKTLAEVQAEAAKAPDLTPVTELLTGIQAAVDTLAGQVSTANARLDGLETRLTDLEKRPITEGASPAAVAAYERELKALQEAMANQRAEIEKMAKEAAAKEANAEMTAQEAMQRTALSQIQTALDTGNGFAEAAESLTASGLSLPPVLAQVAETGVASRAQLSEAFPDAARAALNVARKAEGGGGLGGFLKTQLGARSLEPREGTDADAVLSRAEAAVKEGRLSDAMAELDALPEAARAEMSDWLKTAATRLDALKAADALAAELN